MEPLLKCFLLLEVFLITKLVLFFLVFTLNMGAVLSVILGFAPERDVFLREENSKLYTTFSYFIGK